MGGAREIHSRSSLSHVIIGTFEEDRGAERGDNTSLTYIETGVAINAEQTVKHKIMRREIIMEYNSKKRKR